MILLDIHKKLSAATGEMSLDLQLRVEKEKLITLYGKSGAGKTSTLRMLAGLMTPDHGKIVVNNRVWYDSEQRINVPPQKRRVGFLFQDYALFPNMTVRQNLQFALKKNQDSGIVRELIEIMELSALQDRKPQTLSGGQKQRVALARALVQKPALLMLDEPLSALDIEMREKLQQYILQVHKEFGLTTLLISHDINEILTMSDRIIHLEEGKVIRQGKPEDLLPFHLQRDKLPKNGKLISIEKQRNGYLLSIDVNGQEVLVKINARELP